MEKSTTTVTSDDREIVATRVFNASRELVFKMWADPKHIAQWWGPKGFTNTIHSMDVRPGGVWDFIMHGPDGRDYKNKIVTPRWRRRNAWFTTMFQSLHLMLPSLLLRRVAKRV